MDNFAENLHEFIINRGADIIGFADLTVLPEKVRDGFPVGISVAAKLDPKAVEGLLRGPTKAYEAEYNRLNDLLHEIVESGTEFIRSKGYKAKSISPTIPHLDWSTLNTKLPHKTVATLAGLGWVGKCALLVTEKYGSAVRLASILTDAPLPTARPIVRSRCGTCAWCMDKCPAKAPNGNHWKPGIERSEFFDAFACGHMAERLAKKKKIEHVICGICINACPWTQKYVQKTLYSEH